MEIKQFVSKINWMLEPIEDEINLATKITDDGIEVNQALLMALKETKFNLMIQSLSKEFREGGQFCSFREKTEMFVIFQTWFNDYEKKIMQLEKGSLEFNIECVFLFSAKDMIDIMFEG
jgi:hypothetical protein